MKSKSRQILGLSGIFLANFFDAGLINNLNSQDFQETSITSHLKSNFVSTHISDPIVLESSNKILPFSQDNNVHTFNLSDVLLVEENRYNDFELFYTARDSCGENVFVFNHRAKNWDQIEFRDQEGVCLFFAGVKNVLFSTTNKDVSDYVDEKKDMSVRVASVGRSQLELKVLRINPNYSSLSLRNINHSIKSPFGLTSDNESLWVSSAYNDKIYNLSFDGAILKEFDSPIKGPNALAFDGNNLYVSGGSGGYIEILQLNKDRNVSCRFRVIPPTGYTYAQSLTGLAYGDNKLWTIERGVTRPDPPLSIFSIDINNSCQSGEGIIIDQFLSPPGALSGIAWRKDGLLIVEAIDKYNSLESQKLYEIGRLGKVITSYELPVKDVEEITWDGEAVWMINYGPKELSGNYPSISRFKLDKKNSVSDSWIRYE